MCLSIRDQGNICASSLTRKKNIYMDKWVPRMQVLGIKSNFLLRDGEALGTGRNALIPLLSPPLLEHGTPKISGGGWWHWGFIQWWPSWHRVMMLPTCPVVRGPATNASETTWRLLWEPMRAASDAFN